MKTDEEIFDSMNECEEKIKEVLKEYKMCIGILYDEGISATLRYEQVHPNGDISVREREAF